MSWLMWSWSVRTPRAFSELMAEFEFLLESRPHPGDPRRVDQAAKDLITR